MIIWWSEILAMIQCYFRTTFVSAAAAFIWGKGSKLHLDFTMENFKHAQLKGVVKWTLSKCHPSFIADSRFAIFSNLFSLTP